MNHSIRFLLQIMSLATAAIFALRPGPPAFATAGLAEWEISTPGGNLISHIDPLKDRYGTCLRKADAQPGVVLDDPARVYADQLEWWQYYPGYVAGKARRGLFIFEESSRAVRYFKNERDLADELTRRKVGKPSSQRKTPADGWNEAWLPVIRARCAQLTKDASSTGDTSEAAREAIRKYCDQAAPE